MRITRYSRASGRGNYHHRGAVKLFRRRGGHNGQIPRVFTNQSQPPAYTPIPYQGPLVRRTRPISPEERLLARHDREIALERSPRERYRTDDYSRQSASHDRSLSSVLSDISSASSCFGTVRASEAYGSPVYEDLTDEEDRSLDEMTESSMNLSVAPPPVIKHKKRKKDKRKKEKARLRERKRAKRDKRRQKEILEERICPPEHEVAQSKEIFASGQNILVSVSFIDNEKTKDRTDRHKKSKRKKAKREKTREKLIVTKEERASDVATSARSPHRDSTSPAREVETKDVKEKYNMKQQQSTQSEQEKKQEQQQQQQQQQQQNEQHSTVHQSPEQKIPPVKKKKLDPGVKPVMVIDLERSPGGQVISSPKEVIVLSDEEGKRTLVQRSGKEEVKTNEIDQSNRGPNTPPEPAPKSPDSYDPFEPTKSSPSTAISRHDLGSISSLSFLEHHAHQDDQKDTKNDFHHHSLAQHNLHHQHHHHHHLLHHAHHGHAHHHGHGGQERLMVQTDQQSSSGAPFGNDDGVIDLHPGSPFEKINNLNSSPSRTVTSGMPYHHLHHPSPMKAIIKSMPKKLLASGGGGTGRDARSHGLFGKSSQTNATVGQPSGGGGTTSGGATTSGGVPFEDELNDGDISPYSPRSSDCDEQMFEPPNQDGNGETQTIALTVDNLRKVFGNDPKTLYGDLRKSYQHRSVIAVDDMYKPHKMTLEMLDEIPDSAVDMQVKEKLIKKLQRQERIVEEVKHFLKPHFNKKRIDKDEYKEIMRKSIPKICHSRSGEINPAKIQALITAYVKKAIAKRKLIGGEGSASGTPLVNLGSYGLPPEPTATATSATLPSVMLMNR